MINREELNDFVLFCRDNYNLKIHESAVDNFIHARKPKKSQESVAGEREEENLSECDLGGVGCSYVVFNSAKCDNCVV